MKVGIYSYFANDDKTILYFLKSAKYADEIILCDIGSTDKSNDIIENYKKQNNLNLKVYEINFIPFRYDNIKNKALSLISHDIDLCIFLKVDEYLANDWHKILLQNYDEDITLYHSMYRSFVKNKIYKQYKVARIHTKNYYWNSPINEFLIPKQEKKVKLCDNIWIFAKPTKNIDNALQLCKQSIDENPTDWRAMSYYASMLIKRNECTEAVKVLNNALECENCNKAYLLIQLANAYRLDSQFDDALLAIEQANNIVPNRREIVLEKALLLCEYEKLSEANLEILEATKLNNKMFDDFYNENAWNENFVKIKNEIIKKYKESIYKKINTYIKS